MNRYRFCDAAVDSDLALPLPDAESGTPTNWRCVVSVQPARESEQWDWIHDWSFASGDLALGLATNGHDYLLRFPNLADFVVFLAASKIECRPKKTASESTLKQLLLHQVLPRALSHGGKLIVHASSVLMAEGAMVFLGASEAGKSTLATFFAERGCTLLSDDCLMLSGAKGGNWMAVPSYPGPGKTPFHSAPVRVHRAFTLGPPADLTDREPRIERMTASEGMMSIVSGAFLLDLESPAQLRRVFDLAGDVAAAVPVCKLHFRRTHRALPEVRRAILDHTESSA